MQRRSGPARTATGAVPSADVLEREGKLGRGSNEDDTKAGRQGWPSRFPNSEAEVPRGGLEKAERQQDQQHNRPCRKSLRLNWRLHRSWSLFLREQFGLRRYVRNGIFALVEGKFVLQAPSEYRHGKHQQPQGEQHCASTSSRCIPQERHLAQTLYQKPWMLRSESKLHETDSVTPQTRLRFSRSTLLQARAAPRAPTRSQLLAPADRSDQHARALRRRRTRGC
jgi:hypothetical protein